MSPHDDRTEPYFAGAEGELEQTEAPFPADYRDIVVIGASAGGVEALRALVAELPPELPAAVFVVLHVMPTGRSVLASILDRAGALPVTAAEDGERHDRGHVYVAPPDRHLLLEDGLIRLSAGPRENGHRPAIDPMFRSAARTYGPRVVGIVLSGSLDDGAAGMRFLGERGALTLAQDPDDALYPDMPSNAIASSDVDHVAPVEELARILCVSLEAPVDVEGRRLEDETAGIVEGEDVDVESAALTCPECGGVLAEREEGELVRFACRVGHVYSPDSLVSEQSKALEAALWTALRSLEERADLFRRLARRYRGNERMIRRFEARAQGAEHHAEAIRDAVGRLGADAPEPEAA